MAKPALKQAVVQTSLYCPDCDAPVPLGGETTQCPLCQQELRTPTLEERLRRLETAILDPSQELDSETKV